MHVKGTRDVIRGRSRPTTTSAFVTNPCPRPGAPRDRTSSISERTDERALIPPTLTSNQPAVARCRPHADRQCRPRGPMPAPDCWSPTLGAQVVTDLRLIQGGSELGPRTDPPCRSHRHRPACSSLPAPMSRSPRLSLPEPTGSHIAEVAAITQAVSPTPPRAVRAEPHDQTMRNGPCFVVSGKYGCGG